MRRLIAWNVMTLDGRFEGARPWDLGMHATVWGEDLEAFSLQQGAEIGTLLFGRRTYEGMRDYWTAAEGPVAEMMNALPKAVCSRSLGAAGWANSRVLKGEASETVRALKDEDGRDIFVFGSADLLGTLMAEGLVDAYRLCLAPVVWGEGTPLFRPGSGRTHFALSEARPLATGGVILFYDRKAAPPG